ncbi:MAG: hypothetical protein ACE366_06285 [Bradymonadia bacterium]
MTQPETSEGWFAVVEPEIKGAHNAYAEGNLGKARVGSRRAAGMALKGWLLAMADRGAPLEGYGRNFMHHLNALADDETVQDVAVREAAWRLAARGRPEAGFKMPLPEPLTPMMDAELIIAWSHQQLQH